MSRVGSLPLSLTRTRLNSRSVSPLPLSSALSAETARLDFGTFGTRFCYIGTWNIRKTLPFLKVSIVLNSAGRLSLSLSLSLSPLASLKLEKKRLQNRASFLVLASLFRGTRARRTRWVLLFSRVFCSRGNFLCRPHPKEGQLKNEMQERASLLLWWYNSIIISIIYNSTYIRVHSYSHPVAASTAESFSAQHTTALWCPLYTRIASPLLQSQSRALPSLLAVTKYAASTLNTQSHTHLECPFKVRSNPNPSKFHNFTVLSLLVVAKLLTSGEIKHFNTYSSGCALNLCNGSKCAVVFASFCNRHT